MAYGLRDLDGVRVELCDQCGFDEREPRDLPEAFAEVYAYLARLQDHPAAGRRPEPETWSSEEYAEHCVDGTNQTLAICRPAVELPESTSVASLSEAAAATAELIGALTEPQWDAVTDGWSFDVPVRGAMIHLLHDLEHHLLDVRRGYAKLGLADGIEVVTSGPES
jgi:hypothetical protein